MVSMANVYEHGFRFWSDKPIPHSFETELDVNDELTITIDGIVHSIKIPAGKYETNHNHFSSTLITEINNLLSNGGVPAIARLGGIHDDNPRTVIIFEHTDLTTSGSSAVITAVGGTASTALTSSVPFVTEQPKAKPVASTADSDLNSAMTIAGTQSANSEMASAMNISEPA
jgi:hypothetical protein